MNFKQDEQRKGYQEVGLQRPQPTIGASNIKWQSRKAVDNEHKYNVPVDYSYMLLKRLVSC